jgi:phospholipase/carboxylesterase
MLLPIEWLPSSRPAPQLLILLHGESAGGGAMLALARALREAFAQAAILAPDAPHPGRAGRRWWAGSGAGDADGEAAMQAAVASLAEWVRATQRRLGVGPPATALAGFSQGGTLALALACRHDGLAGRVLSFAGRVPALPATAPASTTLHLLHGGDDPVVAPSHVRAALHRLGALRADASLDLAQGVGHELHPALIDSALFRLRNHIPHRTWRAALGGLPSPST